MTKAKRLIEFIQNPYRPSVNPWSSVADPNTGSLGASKGQAPTSQNKVKRKKETTPANVDVRFIKSED